MAAIYSHISHHAPAVQRPVRYTARLSFWCWPRALPANALRRAQEILCALWLLAAVAFSLLIAAGFVA